MTQKESELLAALVATNQLLVAASFYVPQELADRMSKQLQENERLVREP